MKPASMKSVRRMALSLCLLAFLPSRAKAQDPQTEPTPMDEKARQKAEREAKKAAEQEEKQLKAAAEKERREAEAAARERDRVAARQAKEAAAATAKGGTATENPAPATPSSPPAEALTKEQERAAKAEEKARSEAEKARQKEESRIKAQEAKDEERRRKDEERANREAQKAREAEDKARAESLAKGTDAGAAPNPKASEKSPSEKTSKSDLPKDDDKHRRELVKQIEKARAERDRLNKEAEDAEKLAKTARAAANEGQRAYEALATGLDVEDVTPTPGPAAIPEGPKKSRFVTKADEKQAAAAKSAPPVAADPLRIALDLKNPDADAREKAAFALASLGSDALPATRALMAALTDANPAVRVAAAQALGRIGSGAAAALAPLTAALTDPDPAVKNAAQAALLSIQGR
jgi:hypothetical protein